MLAQSVQQRRSATPLMPGDRIVGLRRPDAGIEVHTQGHGGCRWST